jgi:hypothetical protein
MMGRGNGMTSLRVVPTAPPDHPEIERVGLVEMSLGIREMHLMPPPAEDPLGMATLGLKPLNLSDDLVVAQRSSRPADGDDAVIVKIYRAPLVSA